MRPRRTSFQTVFALALTSLLPGAGEAADYSFFAGDNLDGECDYFSYSFCIDLPANIAITRRDPADFILHSIAIPESVLSDRERRITIYEGSHPPSSPDTWIRDSDFSGEPMAVESTHFVDGEDIRRAIVFETGFGGWPSRLRVTYAARPGVEDDNLKAIVASIRLYDASKYIQDQDL